MMGKNVISLQPTPGRKDKILGMKMYSAHLWGEYNFGRKDTILGRKDTILGRKDTILGRKDTILGRKMHTFGGNTTL